MYCSSCLKKWNGGKAPGIGPVCECGNDGFMPDEAKQKLDALTIERDLYLDSHNKANDFAQAICRLLALPSDCWNYYNDLLEPLEDLKRDRDCLLLRISEVIQEWRKGCSVSLEFGPQEARPELCPECTRGALDAITSLICGNR